MVDIGHQKPLMVSAVVSWHASRGLAKYLQLHRRGSFEGLARFRKGIPGTATLEVNEVMLREVSEDLFLLIAALFLFDCVPLKGAAGGP